jgi:exopolyphosphatase/guanosine-5'-triphosphate,3'-diphosphate pyrophosphatase
LAVVDCGSSAVRAFIVDPSSAGSDYQVLEDLVVPLDLTDGFLAGKLGIEAMDGVVRAVAGIQHAAQAYGITTLRAAATAALRECTNSDVLVERLRSRLGVTLEVIDNAEEARLYAHALSLLCERQSMTLPGRSLFLDLGAGSTCVAVLDDGKLVFSVDEHFGTLRLYEQFKELRDSLDFSITVERFALGAARMMLSRLPPAPHQHLLVAGGEVRRLLELVPGAVSGPFGELSADRLNAWLAGIQPLTPIRRAAACGCDERESAQLLAAASLLRHVCADTGIDRVVVPHLTLRDGLVADLLPGAHGPHHLDDDQLLAEARQLVARYGGNLPYAENTAELSVQIFDQTMELHGLGMRERMLLQFAALVHDVGSYINVRNRHKHSMYIIQAADISGLTRLEKEVVANVARYHRKSPPEPHHVEFQELPRRARVVVSCLAAILRLAYGLDVERTQRIRKVRCTVREGRLLLHVDRRQIALERWSVAGKAGMFGEVFGLAVEVLPREDQ